MSGTTLVCLAPPLSVLKSYTVVMDAAPEPDNTMTNFRLDLADNPMAIYSSVGIQSRTVDLHVNDPIINIVVMYVDT